MEVPGPGDSGLSPQVDPFCGSFGRLIIFHGSGEVRAGAVLHATCNKAKIAVKDVETRLGEEYTCETHINGRMVASVTANSKVTAKQEAKERALAELRKTYYTIKTKRTFVGEPKEPKEQEDVGAQVEKPRFRPLGEGNVGFKILKSLGWVPGTGLSEEGIVNPLEFPFTRTRAGLGCKAYAVVNSKAMQSLKDMVSDYAKRNTFYDLIFDPSTTGEQREQIHKYARHFGLRTKSVWLSDGDKGKEKQRQLTVFKDTDIFLLGELLLSGTLEPDHVLHQKYEIFPPQDVT